MSTPFADPIAAGPGILVIPSLRSPNYVHDVSGWTINRDGSAEFNNLEIRGTFSGSDFILNSSGLFFYNGTPAAGNLTGSWASVAGTDTFGNAYPRGLEVTDGAGDGIHLDTNGQLVILGVGNSTAGFLDAQSAGGSSSGPLTFLSGASNADTVPQVLLLGESQDTTSPAHILLAGFSLSGNAQAALDLYLVENPVVRRGHVYQRSKPLPRGGGRAENR